MDGCDQDTKYTQQDTTSFSSRKRPKPKRTTQNISINTDEVDQEILISIEAAQNKLQVSNAEALKLEKLIRDAISQQEQLENYIAELETDNRRLQLHKDRASPRASTTENVLAYPLTSSDLRRNKNDEDEVARCHFADLFSANIADRMGRSPHRQGRSLNVDIGFRNDDLRRRGRAWKQAELRSYGPPPEHNVPADVPKRPVVPNRQQVDIKELKEQMNRLIMDGYAPPQISEVPLSGLTSTERVNTHRLAELEEALRQQREEVKDAKIRLKTLEEDPFVLYCRRTRE
ncbi:hypothetical protein CJU90_1327 [Yarrowia sp. C11]|nr:hypothetical protein CKK34_0052 [Yarrowia sp. E02]KAG5371313.1 hypothetical protein CJU90_1327 [Yarrowia sp. C11]